MKFLLINSICSLLLTSVSFGQIQKVDEYSWCGTHQKWLTDNAIQAKSGISAPCQMAGNCDVPANRDAKIPTGSTPVKRIHLLLHDIRMDDGSGGYTSYHIDSIVNQINADFAPYKIQFCHSVNLINSTYFSTWDTTKDDSMRLTFTQNPTQQINIFFTNLAYGYTGLGTFPFDPNALTKKGGILLNKNTNYLKKKHVIAHELGHNLGLWHTFRGVELSEVPGGCNDDCYEKVEYSTGKRDSVGDFCSDTPPTPVYFTCDNHTGKDNCSAGSPTWVSLTGSTLPENYMSYTIDSCKNSFTQQQAGRMHCWSEAKLGGYLSYGDTACVNGSKPVVAFSANPVMTCVNSPIQFYDSSSSSTTSWLWEFGDGNTSQQKNPIYSYSTPGIYTVKLTCTNAAGSSSLIKSDYINILSPTQLPVAEDFESGIFPSAEWQIFNQFNDQVTWSLSSQETPEPGYPCYSGDTIPRQVIGNSGLPTKAMVKRYAPYSDSSYTDALVTPVIDLLYAKNSFLTFDVSYQEWTGFTSNLNVYVSTDCWNTSSKVYTKPSFELATVTPSVDCKFIPDEENDWRKDSVSLSSFEGQSYVQIKFEIVSGNGNYVYIDNININSTNAGINDNLSGNLPYLFQNAPNPFEEKTKISIYLPKRDHIQLSVYNVLGEEIIHLAEGTFSQGVHTFVWEPLPVSAGIYSCHLKTSNQLSSIRLVRMKKDN